jgi:hypothetical protein
LTMSEDRSVQGSLERDSRSRRGFAEGCEGS